MRSCPAWVWIAVVLAATSLRADGEGAGLPIRSIHTVGLAGEVQNLHHRLGLQPGAELDLDELERRRRILSRHGGLEHLEVGTAQVGDSVDVHLAVVRMAPLAFRPHLGRAHDQLVWGGEMQFTGDALRGERLSFRFAGSGESRLGLTWHEPRPWMTVPLGIEAEVGVQGWREPLEDGATFERQSARLEIAVPTPVFETRITAELERVSAVPSGVLVDARGRDTGHSVRLAFVRGDAVGRGFAWQEHAVRFDIAGTGGSSEGTSLDFHCRWTLAPTPRIVLATHAGGRSTQGRVPRHARLHFGDARSPRALPYGAAVGDAGAWGALELRFPLNFGDETGFGGAALPLAAHVFADGATAWGARAPGTRTTGAARGRWSAGIGCTAWLRGRFPGRADFGRGDDGIWRLSLSAGMPF